MFLEHVLGWLLFISGLAMMTWATVCMSMFATVRHAYIKTNSLTDALSDVVSKEVVKYLALWLLGVALVVVFK